MGWVYAFVLALARDFVVARWTKEVATSGSRLKASLYSAIPPVLDLCSVLLWLQDWHTVIPTAAGYAVATWFAMTLGTRDAA